MPIEDGTILAVGQGLTADGARIPNADGRWHIPGLWDAHVHLCSSPTEPNTALPLYLLHGVTGFRDMGALWPVESQIALSAELESGMRLVISGAWLDAPPGSWPGNFLSVSTTEAEAVVGTIDALGYSGVRGYSMLSEPTHRALAKAATSYELPLVGHVPETVAMRTAIAAGQDTVAHWCRITRGCAEGEGKPSGQRVRR